MSDARKARRDGILIRIAKNQFDRDIREAKAMGLLENPRVEKMISHLQNDCAVLTGHDHDWQDGTYTVFACIYCDLEEYGGR